MTRFVLGPEDVEDDKGRSALERFAIEEVGLDDPAAFEAAFGALHGEFGPKGEIERRAVVEQWLRSPDPRPYRLLAAHDEQGRVVAVRDCHVRVDAEANAVVVYLAHVLVVPEHRRSGLGSLMRAAPLALARRAAHASTLVSPDLLLAAEMEPAVLEDPASLVRLVAYGKVGFGAIDPQVLPYCQPDFRDPAVIDTARPLPFVAIVRWVGHESASRIPKRLARAYVENLYAVFATHCRASDLAMPYEHSLRVLADASGDDVGLLALPRSPEDRLRIAPLLRERVLTPHSSFVTKTA